MAKKNTGSPLNIIFIVLFLILLIGGGVMAAVYFHVVSIPGLEFVAKLSQDPNKKPPLQVPKKEESSKTTPPSIPKKQEPKKKPVVKPNPVTTDPKKGAKQTAKLWNQIETKKLVDIVKSWSNPDLARVIMQMETGQASALLEALDSSRSAAISKIIQKESSLIPSQTTTNL